MTVTAKDINLELDLVLERFVDVPPELVWRAWTEPEHLKQWFAPRPYKTVRCEVDLRPGGVFRAVMSSPEGEEFDDEPGCYLEVVHGRRLVWTSALLPGFRPKAKPGDLDFTAEITLEARGSGTQYMARAIHADREGAKKHAEMGFHEGWGTALDQLVEHVRTM